MDKKVKSIIALALILALASGVYHHSQIESVTYTYFDNNQTAIVYINDKPFLKGAQTYLNKDITTFEEIIEFTPYIDLTLTEDDLKWNYNQVLGTENITSLDIFIKHSDELNFKSFTDTTLIANETYQIKIIATKKAELGTTAIHLAPTIKGIEISELTWWNASWDNKREEKIDNTGGGALTYYQIYVNLTSTPLNATSIRVVNETADATVPHWCDNVTGGNCYGLWSNITSIPAASWLNSTYYIYYTNPSASSTSNGDATFPFFDTFPGIAIDTDKWTQLPVAPPYEWTQKAPLLGDNILIWGLVELNGKIYGSGGDPGGDLLEWNGVDAWVVKASGTEHMTPIILFNGKIYGAGAEDSDVSGGCLYEWNGVDTWVKVADKLVASTDIQDIIVFDNTIWGIVGKNEAGNDGGELLEWNGVDAWIERAPTYGSQIYGKTLAVLSGELYGGTATNGNLLWYNASGSAWELKAGQYGGEIYIEEMYVYDSKIYVGTGQTGLLLEWNGVDAWVAKTSQWGSNTHLISLIEWNGDLYGGNSNSGELLKWNGVDGWTKQADKYGSETHLFSFIDFSGDLYAGTWPGGKLLKLQGFTGGDIVVSGGTITLTGDGVANGEPKLIGKTDVGVNYAARFKAKLDGTIENTFLGFTDQTTAFDEAYNTGDNAHFFAASDGNVYYYSSDDSAYEGDIGVSSYDTSYHIWEVIRNSSTSVDYLYDDISQGSHTTNVPDANMHLDIYPYTTSTTSIECDWALIRKYSYPDPNALLGAEESVPYNFIYTGANEWILFNNWSSASETFEQIAANESNDMAYTHYNSTSGEWESYWVGYDFNKDIVIDKHESMLGFFDAATTITCDVPSAESISIPATAWYYTYLRESTSHTLSEIKTAMVADGCNIWEIYAFDNTTQNYNSSTSYNVDPNEGFCVYANSSCTWDGGV